MKQLFIEFRNLLGLKSLKDIQTSLTFASTNEH